MIDPKTDKVMTISDTSHSLQTRRTPEEIQERKLVINDLDRVLTKAGIEVIYL